jgi:hypothetical protein
MDEYYAHIKIYKNDNEVQVFQGQVSSIYLENDTVERNDGVMVWHELTGTQRVTLTIERTIGVKQ